MADEIDRAQEISLIENEGMVRAALARAVIPAGEPGVCRHCDEESKRLVNGSCAPCRDEMGLP